MAEDYDWGAARSRMIDERMKLVDRRASLTDELARVNERIVVVSNAIAGLEEMMGLDSTDSRERAKAIRDVVLGPRMVDKISFVLSRWSFKGPMTAREIMATLDSMGYRFEGIPRPVATIHSTMVRLVNSKPPRVKKTRKNGRDAWLWIS